VFLRKASLLPYFGNARAQLSIGHELIILESFENRNTIACYGY
jgi:hypothetical protein